MQDISPPNDTLIYVRVLQDAGVHTFREGPLGLHEGGLLHLPADEAQPFITAGKKRGNNAGSGVFIGSRIPKCSGHERQLGFKG